MKRLLNFVCSLTLLFVLQDVRADEHSADAARDNEKQLIEDMESADSLSSCLNAAIKGGSFSLRDLVKDINKGVYNSKPADKRQEIRDYYLVAVSNDNAAAMWIHNTAVGALCHQRRGNRYCEIAQGHPEMEMNPDSQMYYEKAAEAYSDGSNDCCYKALTYISNGHSAVAAAWDIFNNW
jgi:hypothetical protein